MEQVNYRNILTKAKCLYGQHEVDQAVAKLAEKISADYEDKHVLVYAVMKGGLVFAGRIAPALHFSLKLDYIHATRYRGADQGSGLEWIIRPENGEEGIEGQHVLILDDIFDEGYTLEAIVEACHELKPASVEVAVLCNKLHDRKTTKLIPKYIALEVPDEFIVGYGMDCRGFMRNAPGLYAIDSSLLEV